MSEISLGTVVNILTDDPDRWKYDIDQALELPDLGHIELWFEHIPESRQVNELQRSLAGMDVTVHGPFVDMNLSTPWPNLAELTMARARAAIEVADVLGAGVFTIHAGKFAAYEDHLDSIHRFSERLHSLSEAARVTVAVENVKAKQSGVSREVVATRDDLNRLVSLLPDAKLTVDAAHALQNRDDPSGMIHDFADRLASVHIHDTLGNGPSHLALGDGALNLMDVTTAISNARPRYVTLETLGSAETLRSWPMLHRWLGHVSVSRLVA